MYLIHFNPKDRIFYYKEYDGKVRDVTRVFQTAEKAINFIDIIDLRYSFTFMLPNKEELDKFKSAKTYFKKIVEPAKDDTADFIGIYSHTNSFI